MGKTVAVLGGDGRQAHLAQLLRRDGWDTVTWGAEAEQAVSLEQALEREILIFPLPMCRGGALNLPVEEGTFPWERIGKESILLGGMAGELPRRLMADHGLTLVDYYEREELQIANAAITAEGAVQRMMEETDIALLGSRVLVVGYGRIGKLLAGLLRALGAQVTVSARSCADLAWAGALGIPAIRTGQLEGAVERFDVICNTVPASVLTGSLLTRTKADCLLLELASLPGGVDTQAAAALQRRLIRAPGLPGLVAPRSAAAAVRDTIYHILEERGEPI